MPVTKRPSASGVYVAPVGTKPSDGGWRQIGYIDESFKFMQSDLLAHQDRLNKAAHDYSMPSRWAIGVTGPNWWPQGVELPSNTSTSNERSKPVGLTKEYEYKDSDGDTIEVRKNDDETHAVIGVKDEFYAYIQPEYSVPLALNVLGYDRPELGGPEFASAAGSSYHYTPVTTSDGHRDDLLAQAAANLRAIDLYDQHLVKKKADEEAAAKAAEAEAAKEAQREARIKVRDAAREQVHHWAANLGRMGINGVNLAKLKEATEAYEAAQLKLSGRI